jgi:hypothetical protein
MHEAELASHLERMIDEVEWLLKLYVPKDQMTAPAIIAAREAIKQAREALVSFQDTKGSS